MSEHTDTATDGGETADQRIATDDGKVTDGRTESDTGTVTDEQIATDGGEARAEQTDAKALQGTHPNDRPEPTGRRNSQGIRVDPDAEAEQPFERAVLSATVAHEPGVLAEVSSLFSRRQFNIESLTVGPTLDPNRARITMVIEEPRPGIEQAKKQLAKLVPVVAVRELEDDATLRELALIKVDGGSPDEIQSLAEMYGGQAVDAGYDAITVEITGTRAKIEAAIEAFQRYDVREVTRTGTTAMSRGSQETGPEDPPTNTPTADD